MLVRPKLFYFSYNIDYENEYLEIYLQLKTQGQKSQFKPIIIRLDSLAVNTKTSIIWDLPKKSYIKVRYLIYIENSIDHVKQYEKKKHQDENPNFDDLKNNSNRPKIIKQKTSDDMYKQNNLLSVGGKASIKPSPAKSKASSTEKSKKSPNLEKGDRIDDIKRENNGDLQPKKAPEKKYKKLSSVNDLPSNFAFMNKVLSTEENELTPQMNSATTIGSVFTSVKNFFGSPQSTMRKLGNDPKSEKREMFSNSGGEKKNSISSILGEAKKFISKKALTPIKEKARSKQSLKNLRDLEKEEVQNTNQLYQNTDITSPLNAKSFKFGDGNESKYDRTTSSKLCNTVKKDSRRQMMNPFAFPIEEEKEVDIKIDKEEAKITYLQYEVKSIDDIKENSFCEGFFLAGLNKDNLETIVNFEETKATCNHSDCSILFPYKPKIIAKVQKNSASSSLEINDILASFCFPSGLKLCFNQNEKDEPTTSDFLTFITNELGERFYLMVYNYMIKYKMEEFQDEFNVDSGKEYFTHIQELETSVGISGDKLDKLLESNLATASKLVSSKYVYVPQSACLISRFPYAGVMKDCLESFAKLAADDKADVKEVISFIKNIIYEIPIPPDDTRILFYIPYCNNSTELPCLYYKDLSLLNFPIKTLIDQLSVDMIIMVLHLILLEQKLLFVSDLTSDLSFVIDAFLALIYPLRWQRTIIPILSDDLLQYVQSFMPFIMGINEKQLKNALNLIEEEQVFIIYIKKNQIELASNPGKKIDRKLLNKLIPPFPEEFLHDIISDLKDTKKKITEDSKSKKPEDKLNPYDLERNIREMFILMMVQLFGDYKKYLSYLDNVALFNSDGFLLKRDKAYNAFFSDLTSTQNFRQFLQNLDNENVVLFDKLCVRYVSSINNAKAKRERMSFKLQDRSKRSSSVKNNNFSYGNHVPQTPDLLSVRRVSGYNYGHLEKYFGETNNLGIVSNKENSFNVSFMTYKEYQLDFKEHYIVPPLIFGGTFNQFEFLSIEESLSEHYKNYSYKSFPLSCRVFSKENFKEKDLQQYFITLDAKERERIKKEKAKEKQDLSHKEKEDNCKSHNSSGKNSRNNSPFKDSLKPFDLKYCRRYIVPSYSFKSPESKIKIKDSSPNIKTELLILNQTKSSNQNYSSITHEIKNSVINKDKSYSFQSLSTINQTNLKEKDTDTTPSKKFTPPIAKESTNTLDSEMSSKNDISIPHDSLLKDKEIGDLLKQSKTQITDSKEKEMKQKINDALRCILSSEKISDEVSSSIQNIFSDKFSRTYFSKLIFQQKFYEMKWQCLNDSGFNELYKMIYACLLYSKDDEEFESVYYITKSLFFYYKYDKKNKNCFLSQEIVRRSNTFDIWLTIEFWSKWFEMDVDKSENNMTNIEDFYFSILLTMASYMKDLNLDLSIITCYIVDNLSIKYIQNVSNLISYY